MSWFGYWILLAAGAAVGAVAVLAVWLWMLFRDERRTASGARRGTVTRLAALGLALVLVAASGCVSVAYTRNPWSDGKLEVTYQATRTAAMASIIVAFPQMMSDCPSDYGAYAPLNLLTVPLGVLVLADAVVEAVPDTV